MTCELTAYLHAATIWISCTSCMTDGAVRGLRARAVGELPQVGCSHRRLRDLSGGTAQAAGGDGRRRQLAKDHGMPLLIIFCWGGGPQKLEGESFPQLWERTKHNSRAWRPGHRSSQRAGEMRNAQHSFCRAHLWQCFCALYTILLYLFFLQHLVRSS